MSSTQTKTTETVCFVRKPEVIVVPKCKSKNSSVFEQLHDFRKRIPANLLREWETPTGIRSAVPIAQDWLLILGAHQLFLYQPGWITFFASIFLMAWGQRGLSNLAHDSIHRNLAVNKRLNDVIADLFLSPPLMTTARIQRLDHTAHHHYLGTEKDPDHGTHNETSLKHYREGRFDHTSIWSLFAYDLFDPILFRNYALGSIKSAPLLLTSWWIAVSVLLHFLEPASATPVPISWTFSVLFHTARLTISYCCYVFRETIDHSGLPPTSILKFTRTSPCCNIFQKFLQPHDDNYHLLHHLLPKIPMSRLHEAHLWLVKNVEAYAEANRHPTYFSGKNPLFSQSLHVYQKGQVIGL